MILETLIGEAHDAMDRYWLGEKELNRLENEQEGYLTELTKAARVRGKGNYQAIKLQLGAIEHQKSLAGLKNSKSKAGICRKFIRQLERELENETFRRLVELPGRFDSFKNLNSKGEYYKQSTAELAFEIIRIKQRVEVIMAKADGYIDVLKTIAEGQIHKKIRRRRTIWRER